MRQVSRRAGAELVEAAEPAQAPDLGPSPFRSRFGFILGALLGIAVAAGAAFVLLLGSKPPTAIDGRLADHWSRWLPPSGDIIAGPQAIADHVEAQYKRDDGKQLVTVHGGPFYYAGATAPLPFAVRLQPTDGSILDLGSIGGVLYTLAGTGDSGKIVGEKASPERHRLLRREALELALYTFRYVDNSTMFVALLPAAARAEKKKASSGSRRLEALFFRPGDLRRQLQTPLARTLKPVTKLQPKQLEAAEAATVDKLTKGNLFEASFTQQVDGQLYLVLKRSR
jgi:hypothetical protein